MDSFDEFTFDVVIYFIWIGKDKNDGDNKYMENESLPWVQNLN